MARSKNALDHALEFGASFDWITPLASLLSSDVRIVCDSDDQNAADAALSNAGIAPKRRMEIRDTYSFDVDKGDAGKARKALSKAGVSFW